ncbi:MAG: transposase [Candidatus Omnitrophica bacterium]|nr:transposase [Candidatus Omnitrophota bacterium]
MARPLRIEFPGAWYHVMNRGRQRGKIFFRDRDNETFLQILNQASLRFSFEIHAYVLMPNHYHLLVHTPKGNLSRAMRHINGVYTQRMNARYRTDGPLFRGRYKSIIVDQEEYLLEVMRYIHWNPFKAKLEERLGDYKWCSYRGYMNGKNREDFLRTEEVLSRFSKYEKEAREKLSSFVKKEVPKDLMKLLEGLTWPAVLGGKKFKKSIEKIVKGNEINMEEVPSYRRDIIDKRDLDRIKLMLLSKYREAMNARCSKRLAPERRALVFVMKNKLDMSLKEISEIMGGVKYTAISNQYKKAEEEVNSASGCYSYVKEIDKRVKWKVKT